MNEPALLTAASAVFELEGERRGELARDLVRLEIEEGTDGLKTLRVRFLAFGPGDEGSGEGELYLDGTLFDFGKRLAVILGPEAESRLVFDGRISALESCFEEGREPEVVVYAEDRLMDLRWTRRMRAYEQVSDADVATALAGEHGLEADVDAPGPTYDVLQQWNQSDLAFLRDRGRRLQAEVWVQDGRLCFKSRQRRNATELTLVRGNDLIAVKACADLAHQRSAVHVSGFDADRREALDESAGPDVLLEEAAGGRTGPAILEAAFGERSSFRVRDVPLAAPEARDWARAEMLRRGRGFVQVVGTTRGTADLMVGSRLTLERVARPFEGDGYYTTRVCHTLDLAEGHRTHFEAERPAVEVAR